MKLSNPVFALMAVALAIILSAVVAVYALSATGSGSVASALAASPAPSSATADLAATSGNADPVPGTVHSGVSQSAPIAWCGCVVDSFGKPLGDVTVTLHLVAPGGEVSSMTTWTRSGNIYPGSYVFDCIRVSDGYTSAYAEADTGDLGAGLRYAGRTKTLALNTSRVSSGILRLEPVPA